MKIANFFKYISVIAMASLVSCDGGLNQTPLSQVTAQTYFNTANDLRQYTNSFYTIFPGEDIYNGDNASDNIMQVSTPERVRGDRIVPSSEGGWTWSNLRKINYFLGHYQKVNNESAKQEYSGVAHFFRAYFYFQKVKRFGDVPWYSKPISSNDRKALQKERDPRGMVIDSVMADLDYAIEHLPVDKNVYRVTKWTALALKSRVGLFEGTFQKYHNQANYQNNYKKYLQNCVDASQELMNSGTYEVYSTGHPQTDYRDLYASHDAIASAVILARQYSTGLTIQHNANYYTLTSSYGKPGMPKDMVDSYLMNDGSRFTDKSDFDHLPFAQEVKNRDPRLAQTIRVPGYHRIGGSETLPPKLGNTVTGYQLIKFVTEPDYDGYNKSINDLPIFQYSEVLENYAEAKAELGELTQADLDASINQLRDRVAMPHLILAQANANPDPFLESQYLNVKENNKGVILEIRRSRRIELYMEDFRWDDLMRWKEGQKVTQPFRGMYFPGPGQYDLDDDGNIDVNIYEGSVDNEKQGITYLKLGEDIVLDNDGLINPEPNINSADRNFDEDKDYLYPIPKNQLLLNKNLTQNPGWGE